MKRAYYSDTIANFCKSSPEDIVGKLTINSQFAVETTQRDAWLEEITILHNTLGSSQGKSCTVCRSNLASVPRNKGESAPKEQ